MSKGMNRSRKKVAVIMVLSPHVANTEDGLKNRTSLHTKKGYAQKTDKAKVGLER